MKRVAAVLIVRWLASSAPTTSPLSRSSRFSKVRVLAQGISFHLLPLRGFHRGRASWGCRRDSNPHLPLVGGALLLSYGRHRVSDGYRTRVSRTTIGRSTTELQSPEGRRAFARAPFRHNGTSQGIEPRCAYAIPHFTGQARGVGIEPDRTQVWSPHRQPWNMPSCAASRTTGIRTRNLHLERVAA